MSSNFSYTSMTVTGVLHVISGMMIFFCCCAGYGQIYRAFNEQNGFDHDFPDFFQIRAYLSATLAASVWAIMVGTLGILTGRKNRELNTTNSLKIAYMVTAILSAVIFSQIGIGMSYAIFLGRYTQVTGILCSIISFFNFVLSIVSASICCCCARTTNTTGFVYVQSTEGNYPPVNYPVGNYPPGAYPTANYMPGTYPAPPPYSFHPQYPSTQSPQEGLMNPSYQPNPIPPSESESKKEEE